MGNERAEYRNEVNHYRAAILLELLRQKAESGFVTPKFEEQLETDARLLAEGRVYWVPFVKKLRSGEV